MSNQLEFTNGTRTPTYSEAQAWRIEESVTCLTRVKVAHKMASRKTNGAGAHMDQNEIEELIEKILNIADDLARMDTIIAEQDLLKQTI